jgi:hypothetical protein
VSDEQVFRPKEEISTSRYKDNVYNLFFFYQIIIMGKNHGVCEWPVTDVGEMKCSYKSLLGKPEGKTPLGRPDIDGRIILMVIKDVACLF